MNDAELRRLQRQGAQGSLEARAQGVGERLRRGTLSRDRVRIGALLGDPAARAISAEVESLPPRDWIQGLEDLGLGDCDLLRATRIRLALAALGVGLPRAKQERGDLSLQRLLELAQDLGWDPWGEASRVARRRWRLLDPDRFHLLQGSIRLIVAAAEFSKSSNQKSARSCSRNAIRFAVELWGAEEVCSSVRAAVLPWLLEDFDPLALA